MPSPIHYEKRIFNETTTTILLCSSSHDAASLFFSFRPAFAFEWLGRTLFAFMRCSNTSIQFFCGSEVLYLLEKGRWKD
jgi:hypothetical protein